MCSDSRTCFRAKNIKQFVFLKANVAYFKWLLHVTGTLFDHFEFFTLFRWYIIRNINNINNIIMFRVIQLFEFVFGQIVHRTIRIRPNSLKPLFGTSLVLIPLKSPLSWVYATSWILILLKSQLKQISLHEANAVPIWVNSLGWGFEWPILETVILTDLR